MSEEAPVPERFADVREVALGEREWPLPWMGPFLAVLASTLNVTSACRAVGRSRPTVYDAAKTNPEFAAAWREAEAVGVDILHAVAHKYATTGRQVVKKRTVSKEGKEEVTEETYVEVDTGMLRWLLARHAPERFGDHVEVTHTGPDGGPVEHVIYRERSEERALEVAFARLQLELERRGIPLKIIEGTSRLPLNGGSDV